MLIIINTMVCISLSLGIKQSWWARYAPYIYFISLIALFIMLNSNSIVIKKMLFFFVIVLTINNFSPLYWVKKDLEDSKTIYEKINDLKNGYVEVYAKTFKGIYFNLKDMDVAYETDSNLLDDDTAIELGYRDLIWKQR